MSAIGFLREDKAKLKRELTQEAVHLAISGRWEEAAAINREIIESFPHDSEAFNRLGRALMEMGRYGEAREAYGRALEIDPYNTIARKNLSRLALIQEGGPPPQPERHRVVPQLFMSETGKAGVVSLIRPASPEVLARLAAGDEVSIQGRGQRLVAEDGQGVYLGEVDPHHSLRLLRLMAGGNRYSAAIASISLGEVKVIIREVHQHPNQAGQLSFPVREAEAFAPMTMRSEEEESLPLEEGDEEPLTGMEEEAGVSAAEGGGGDWENPGD